jgi:hypothetical protein
MEALSIFSSLRVAQPELGRLPAPPPTKALPAISVARQCHAADAIPDQDARHITA